MEVDWFLSLRICAVHRFVSRKLSTKIFPHVVVYTILISVGVVLGH